MSGSISVRGGLRVGWLHASWPLATLTASEDRLSVSALLVGGYDFTPDQVIALEPHGNVPVIGRGIRLRHSRPDYPRRIVFWCSGSPEQLVARIQRDVGFLPRSSGAAAHAMGTGMPVRPRALVAAVATWTALGLLSGLARRQGATPPGPFPLILVASVFLGTVAIRRSPRLQAWALKPGRSVGEIQAGLSALQFASGFLLAVLGAALIVARVAGS
jgi:hypothetical protein